MNAYMEYITIAGFEQLTQQSIFDMAYKHVMATKKQSVDSYGRGTYGNVGCAASPFLIKEERAYAVGSWDSLRKSGIVPSHEKDLIIRIQKCHDDWLDEDGDFLEFFKGRMRQVADDFDLKVPNETQP